MNDLVNWDRPEKGIARAFAMVFAAVVYKVYLCMPSHSCLCLKLGLITGVLKRTTKVIAIDNNPDNWMRIERFLKKHFDNYIFFRGEVSNFPMMETMQASNFPKIDFAFFDLCENFNGTIAHWLYKNREAFTGDCRFGLTVTAPTRLKHWEKVVQSVAIDMCYTDVLEDLMVETKNNLAKDIVGLPIEVKSNRQQVKKNRAAERTMLLEALKPLVMLL